MSIWLVGAGPMATLHAQVLADLGLPTTIIATSATRAGPLAEKFGMQAFTNGLSGAVSTLPLPRAAIIALPVDRLAEAAELLATAGVPRILIEKPGGLSAAELESVEAAAGDSGSEIFIAYNRRFFASVIEARRRIAEAGQVLSVAFEFCEDADRIAALPTSASIKDRWVIANSSHVIDLAFHLCGRPVEWKKLTAGSLPWHPAAADFRGMGVTETGARFSYFADWRGPGRWGIEIVLPRERLILRPVESLSVVPRGKFTAEPVELDDRLDRAFKPGLHAQMTGFLAETPAPELVSLREQMQALRDIYCPMANYAEEPR